MGRQLPSPLSLRSQPLWNSRSGGKPEKLIRSLSPKMRTAFFLGSSVFTSIFPLIIIFYHLTFIQSLLSNVQTSCTSYELFTLCKVPLRYVIGIETPNFRQIWQPPFQIKQHFGSVITACHEQLQSRMITTLYALNAESRYVTGKLLG